MATEPDLVISAGFSDAQLVKEANKVVEFYRKRGQEAQKAFQAAAGRVTNTEAARANARELDRLSKAYDPVYRATKKYEAEVKRLDRALDVGAISQTQYTQKVAEAARAMNQATQATSAGTTQMAAEFDSLRQRFNPLYAASKQYEVELDALNRAHQVGAINTQQYEAANERLAQSFLQVRGSAGAARAGFGSMEGSIGNVAAQFNDIGVTAAGGMSPMLIALQQGTQLSQAFAAQGGSLKSVVGSLGGAFRSMVSPVALVTIGLTAVAAVAIQAATSFLSAGGEAETLEDAVNDLGTAIDDYRDSVELANSPTAVLAEKYGIAADKASKLLDVIAQINRIEAASALAAGADAIAGRFDGLIELFGNLENLTSGQNIEAARLRWQIEALASSFGLTVDQARELSVLLQDQRSADTLQEQSASIQAIATFLGEAAEATNYQNAALNEAAKEAARAAAESLRLAETNRDAAAAANDLSLAVGNIDFSNAIAEAGTLAARIGGMIGQARTLLSVLGQAQQGNLDAGNRRELVELERDLVTAGKDRVEIEGRLAALRKSQELDVAGVGLPVAARDKLIADAQETAAATQAAIDETEAYREALAEAERAEAKAAKSGGGSKKKGKTERPFFENIEQDLVNLERQISLVGKSNEEVATARARWSLLDEAKKRGLPINEQLNEQINAQAAEVGRLTGELERAEIAQQQFDQAIEGIADSMAGALFAGESLRDGLAQVLKGIASDIINSGIRNALTSQFGGGGGLFGGIFGSLFGGDPLTSALRGAGLPARANGGPVSAGSMYMTGERGPEPFIPAVDGRILSVSQAQAALRGGGTGSAPKIVIHNNAPGVSVEANYVTKDEVGIMISAQGKALSNQMNQKLGDRKRY